MNQLLRRFRYYLEIISVPVFALLIIHMSGHGLMLMKDRDHQHSNHAEESIHTEDETKEEHDAYDEPATLLDLEYLLSTEVLGGILCLLLFVWLWHRPQLKRFVPCSHDHCHHLHVWPHLLASLAFVFHFFPESQLRYEIMESFDWHSVLSLAGLIGFLSHFLVDIIVMILLSQFWGKPWQKALSMITMVALWLSSFYVGMHGGLHLEGISEPIILLISAFLITMFIHKPHRPKTDCKSCEHK